MKKTTFKEMLDKLYDDFSNCDTDTLTSDKENKVLNVDVYYAEDKFLHMDLSISDKKDTKRKCIFELGLIRDENNDWWAQKYNDPTTATAKTGGGSIYAEYITGLDGLPVEKNFSCGEEYDKEKTDMKTVLFNKSEEFLKIIKEGEFKEMD